MAGVSSALMEIRPRLGVANFFITVTSTVSLKDTKIEIKPDSIQIHWTQDGENVEQLQFDTVRLIPDTMSGFQADSDYITFRIKIDPPTPIHGSVSSEFIPTPSSEPHLQLVAASKIPMLSTDVEYSLC